MNNTILLQCINLYKSYPDGESVHHVLKKVYFVLNIGDMISIIGKSGSGKSTLLHLIGGLDTPTSGDVFFCGQSLNQMSDRQTADFRNKKIGFIHQFHHLLLDFTVLENVFIPLLISKINRSEAMEKAYKMLKKVHLEKKTHQYPAELSGGERQKVAIARALINNPSLILADEPTGHLDQYNTDIILDLMRNINHEYNTSFIIVTHDDILAKKMPILLAMNNGHLVHY